VRDSGGNSVSRTDGIRHRSCSGTLEGALPVRRSSSCQDSGTVSGAGSTVCDGPQRTHAFWLAVLVFGDATLDGRVLQPWLFRHGRLGLRNLDHWRSSGATSVGWATRTGPAFAAQQDLAATLLAPLRNYRSSEACLFRFQFARPAFRWPPRAYPRKRCSKCGPSTELFRQKGIQQRIQASVGSAGDAELAVILAPDLLFPDPQSPRLFSPTCYFSTILRPPRRNLKTKFPVENKAGNSRRGYIESSRTVLWTHGRNPDLLSRRAGRARAGTVHPEPRAGQNLPLEFP